MAFWKRSRDGSPREPEPGAPESLVVRPCYRQFYLRRGEADWNSDKVSHAGYERGLEEIGGFVYVGTTMYSSPTSVTVQLHPSDPGLPATADRAVETAIGGEGDLAILNWEPGAPAVATIRVPTGRLSARVSWRGLGAAEHHPDNDTGGDELSPEYLTIDLWPLG
ncbi:MAG: hypothetical protein ACOYMR_02625 [Ilumatobacteraceae bacterium]